MIFTSQLDVNNVACRENTAPHLTSAGSCYNKAGSGFPAQEMGAVQGKSAVPGHRAVPQHPDLLQVLPYLKGLSAERGRHEHTLNKQEPLISEKVSRQ